ncbi:MAG TPA: 7TM-DISM domain-containing protein [Cytophagaceae bacterium]|jgi:hypothetical protein
MRIKYITQQLFNARLLLLAIIFLCHFKSIAGTFSKVFILKEEKKNYTIAELLQSNNLPLESFVSEISTKENKSYWIRFTYSKKAVQETTFLFAPYILFKRMDLYYNVEDSLHHYKTGVSLKFEERNLYLPVLYLKLPTLKNPTQCWLHVESFHGYFFFFGEDTIESLIKRAVRESSITYFYIGLSFLAGIISLIFYFFLKDRMYLFYSIFSIMIMLNRLVYSGYIFSYINFIYKFDSLKSIYNLYSLVTAGFHLSILLYLHEYLKYLEKPRYYNGVIYSLISLRLVILLLELGSMIPENLLSVFGAYEFLGQLFLFYIIITRSSNNVRLGILAGCSILIINVGNFILLLSRFGLVDNNLVYYNNYHIFLALTGIEVVVFSITMAYRNHFLKEERDKSMFKIMENLKEKEQLKDQLNQELERKVEERTLQIQKMNEVLKSHNIKLESEVKNVIEGRVFHRTMDFEEFRRFFPDDQSCFLHLAKFKWKANEKHYCRKCDYPIFPAPGTLSVRCGKCLQVESVTTDTLFHKLKFSILKAFYIIYRTSNAEAPITNISLAQEIELRVATLWAFKKKLSTLVEETKSMKKHKDGWTHLIEYSTRRINSDDNKPLQS